MSEEFQWTHNAWKFRETQSEYKCVMLMTKEGTEGGHWQSWKSWEAMLSI